MLLILAWLDCLLALRCLLASLLAVRCVVDTSGKTCPTGLNNIANCFARGRGTEQLDEHARITRINTWDTEKTGTTTCTDNAPIESTGTDAAVNNAVIRLTAGSQRAAERVAAACLKRSIVSPRLRSCVRPCVRLGLDIGSVSSSVSIAQSLKSVRPDLERKRNNCVDICVNS